MIYVECPHCKRKHNLSQTEIEELTKSGKLVVSNCTCEIMFTIEQGDDYYFVKGDKK